VNSDLIKAGADIIGPNYYLLGVMMAVIGSLVSIVAYLIKVKFFSKSTIGILSPSQIRRIEQAMEILLAKDGDGNYLSHFPTRTIMQEHRDQNTLKEAHQAVILTEMRKISDNQIKMAIILQGMGEKFK
jgi:hypothetical protein